MVKQKILRALRPPLTDLSIHFFCFFFMLPRLVSSKIDRHFEACRVPKSCGDGQNISFPFYIANQQESFCGFPGFELTCDTRSGKPILKLRDKDYIVHHISYSNLTLRVSNAAVLGQDSNGSGLSVCSNGSGMPKNLSLPEERFQLVSNTKSVFLFYYCNLTGVPGNVLPHKIGECGNGTNDKGNNSTLAIYDDRASVLELAKARCGRAVAVPVEHRRGGEGGGEGFTASVEKELRDGFWLKWVASNCSVCEQSGGKCGFNRTIYHFKCFCPDRPHAWWCAPPTPTGQESLKSMKLGLGIGGPVILVIILAVLLIIQQRFRRRNTSALLSGNISTDPGSKSDIETSNVYFKIPVFSYNELEEATNNFNSERLLGDGGFGTVYYGKLRDGREVAVKRLYEHNFRRVEQFMNEIEILTRLQHKNLVSLYGCTSRHSRELLLVYEFVPNGTVAKHLHGHLAKPGSVTWPMRMSIAIETASALAYLHASDIIHRDVKTDNILLDRNFSVKVADFGLSRLLPNDVTHVSTAPQGTPGYVDPEYYQCYHLTDKSDVYSFGVVLVELISSMPAVDMNRSKTEINLSNLAVNRIQKHAFHELIDPNLGYETNDEVRHMTRMVAELAFQCLQQDKEMRPTMDEVLQELTRIQNGESLLHVQEENHNNNEEMKRRTPPSSPANWDEALLLKNIGQPHSPISVTEQWISRSTTPSTSGQGSLDPSLVDHHSR